MKFGCELLPELIFEKTQIYYANFQILYFSIIFSIKTYPKIIYFNLFSCSGDVLHHS